MRAQPIFEAIAAMKRAHDVMVGHAAIPYYECKALYEAMANLRDEVRCENIQITVGKESA